MTTGTGLLLLGIWLWASVCTGVKHLTENYAKSAVLIAVWFTLAMLLLHLIFPATM